MFPPLDTDLQPNHNLQMHKNVQESGILNSSSVEQLVFITDYDYNSIAFLPTSRIPSVYSSPTVPLNTPQLSSYIAFVLHG